MTSNTFSLNETTYLLKSLNYVIARLIEFHAQFIYCNGEYFQIIRHGFLIGHLSDVSKIIQARLYELYTPPTSLKGSEQINTFLNEIIFQIDFSSLEDAKIFFEKEKALLASLKKLLLYVSNNKIDMVADLPSFTCLKCSLVYIDLAYDVLSEFCQSASYDLECLIQPQELSLDLSETSLPKLSDEPHKPSCLKKSKDRIFDFNSLDELCRDINVGRAFYHFVLVDIELTAMQVCAYMILNNRNENLKFRNSMARQIYDEARHAILIKSILDDLSGKIGDYTYSHLIWHRTMKSSDIKEQLAIQQVIQEGNALQDNFLLIDALGRNNLNKFKGMLEFINADESVHVFIGNYWLKYFCDQKKTDIKEIISKASDLIEMEVKQRNSLTSDVLDVSGFYLTMENS